MVSGVEAREELSDLSGDFRWVTSPVPRFIIQIENSILSPSVEG